MKEIHNGTLTHRVLGPGAIVDPSDSAQHDALAVALCETLDTQVQSEGPAGSGAPHDGSGAPPDADGDGDGPHGGKGGGKGGGGMAHCVEVAP